MSDALSVTTERVRKVLGSTNLPHQMEGTFRRLLQSAIDRNSPNLVPEIEIEGIIEIVSEHIWHPALSALSMPEVPK